MPIALNLAYANVQARRAHWLGIERYTTTRPNHLITKRSQLSASRSDTELAALLVVNPATGAIGGDFWHGRSNASVRCTEHGVFRYAECSGRDGCDSDLQLNDARGHRLDHHLERDPAIRCNSFAGGRMACRLTPNAGQVVLIGGNFIH